ncbi:hypothetical protein Fcan01_00370 [Folsomia candida]|uniref:Uncharacterized protein n=1 Tax=Folsomia candida TaxID=158441 RepID=A0A226EXZ0_FOLCA|nr:hypothetical protein Fcan01_00370 [Folsomia candida]
MLLKIYFAIFLQTISVTSKPGQVNISHIDRLFPHQSVLNIMGDFNTSHPKLFDYKLFKFLQQNLKFSKVLHPLPNNDIEHSLQYQNCSHNQYTDNPKYYLHYATKIFVIFLPKIEPQMFYDLQNKLNYCGENPTYMFLILSTIQKIDIHAWAGQTTSLFVMHHPSIISDLVHIYVICHTCPVQLVEVPAESVDDINALYAYWKRENSNLHHYHIQAYASVSFDPNKFTCRAIKRGNRAFSHVLTCAQLTLGDKYNYTDVKIPGRQYPPDEPRAYPDILYNMAVTKQTFEGILHPVRTLYSWLPNCGTIYQFKLAVVTFEKLKVDGVQGITLPLDVYTWAASGISFILISILLGGIGYKKSGVVRDCVSNFTQCAYWIFCCLCGQYHGTPAILSVTALSCAVFVIFWVVMFFLVGTVFYQGAIFSSLIAMQPPSFSSDLESVVDSEIQIITTTYRYTNHHGYGSMLRDLLRDEISIMTKSDTGLLRILSKLNKSVEFIPTHSSFTVGLNISESWRVQFDSGEVKKAADTFAVLNLEGDLAEILAGIGLKGDPHIVTSLEEPIFFLQNPILVKRWFFYPFISHGFGQLAQSGLYDFWIELTSFSELMNTVRKYTTDELYRKVVITRLYKVRKEIVFEEEKSVSVSALDSVPPLVGVLFGAGLLIFLGESIKWQGLRYLFLKWRQYAAEVAGCFRQIHGLLNETLG